MTFMLSGSHVHVRRIVAVCDGREIISRTSIILSRLLHECQGRDGLEIRAAVDRSSPPGVWQGRRWMILIFSTPSPHRDYLRFNMIFRITLINNIAIIVVINVVLGSVSDVINIIIMPFVLPPQAPPVLSLTSSTSLSLSSHSSW